MNMDTLVLCLRIAGVLHLGVIWAGASMPRAVGLWGHIEGLPPFIRRLFCVYYAFIGLCLVGFGAVTVVYADVLAGGGSLSRAVCAFFAVFWTLRLVVAAFVFDVRPYLKNRYLWAGYQASNITFAYLPIVYACAALRVAGSA